MKNFNFKSNKYQLLTQIVDMINLFTLTKHISLNRTVILRLVGIYLILLKVCVILKMTPNPNRLVLWAKKNFFSLRYI